MATICFGPPPLPPNKRSLLVSGSAKNRKQNHSLLSSTYLSFRDPAEENEIVAVATEEEVPKVLTKTRTKGRRGLVHTNSLCRSRGPKTSLVRSQSDGNLDKLADFAPMTINKYIKVLSGSWRNLLQCKLRLGITSSL